MANVLDRFRNLSTADTASSAPTLDTLPEDILQLVISYLSIEEPGVRNNVNLSGVEKDAQDIVFARSPWNSDLDNLATVSRRLREEVFYKTMLRVIKVKDTVADLNRTSQVIPKSKRGYVQSHALDSLDVHLPSALLESVDEDKVAPPISVHSLTLRSYDESMLHLPGPFVMSKLDWLHNVVRQVKDVRQLNLHTGLEDDADENWPTHSRLPKYDPFPGLRKEDFVGLESLNVYFETRYRKDGENPCDFQLWTHFLTHFAPTIRHIRFFIQYPELDEIAEHIQELDPADLPQDRSVTDCIKRYFPTLDQIDTLLEKTAEAIPALQTFEMKFDDRRAHPPPLIHYSATVQEEERNAKSGTGIVKHIRTVDAETMSWFIESVAELLGLGGAMGDFGDDWEGEFDEMDEDGDPFDDFYDPYTGEDS
ncbi:hypothetical protein QFC19_004203 [Naganishia cerealis]|uniref:Uncharacterized protein n=1 Tax=Naganishia cerealis TaxID=610337 RepID=A0ACC2VW33_9TREE|nr:hypothetical protein QFC19_004203 [Naganishia cerealis]